MKRVTFEILFAALFPILAAILWLGIHAVSLLQAMERSSRE